MLVEVKSDYNLSIIEDVIQSGPALSFVGCIQISYFKCTLDRHTYIITSLTLIYSQHLRLNGKLAFKWGMFVFNGGELNASSTSRTILL